MIWREANVSWHVRTQNLTHDSSEFLFPFPLSPSRMETRLEGIFIRQIHHPHPQILTIDAAFQRSLSKAIKKTPLQFFQASQFSNLQLYDVINRISLFWFFICIFIEIWRSSLVLLFLFCFVFLVGKRQLSVVQNDSVCWQGEENAAGGIPWGGCWWKMQLSGFSFHLFSLAMLRECSRLWECQTSRSRHPLRNTEYLKCHTRILPSLPVACLPPEKAEPHWVSLPKEMQPHCVLVFLGDTATRQSPVAASQGRDVLLSLHAASPSCIFTFFRSRAVWMQGPIH